MSALFETNGEWVQEGTFPGADGRPIRPYDDVVLLRQIPVEGGVGTDVNTVPAGTIGTVIFVQLGPPVTAQVECHVGDSAFTFGFEELGFLQLHQTNEEKYPR